MEGVKVPVAAGTGVRVGLLVGEVASVADDVQVDVKETVGVWEAVALRVGVAEFVGVLVGV